jgi:hypothetical protein
MRTDMKTVEPPISKADCYDHGGARSRPDRTVLLLRKTDGSIWVKVWLGFQRINGKVCSTKVLPETVDALLRESPPGSFDF